MEFGQLEYAVVAVSRSLWHHDVALLQLGEVEQPGLRAAVVWEWGRKKCAAIPHLRVCSVPHLSNTSLLLDLSSPTSCPESFLHHWGIIFSAPESCCCLTCTQHATNADMVAVDKKDGQLQGQLTLSFWYSSVCSRGCTIKTASVKYHFESDVIIPDTVQTRPRCALWRSVTVTHSDLQRHEDAKHSQLLGNRDAFGGSQAPTCLHVSEPCPCPGFASLLNHTQPRESQFPGHQSAAWWLHRDQRQAVNELDGFGVNSGIPVAQEEFSKTRKGLVSKGRISLSVLTLFSLRMKRVNRIQKSVAATQVQVRVISSRFDLSDVPGKIKW